MQLREKLFSALMPPREPHVVDERVEGPKRIAVVIRPDGDIQVEFHIDGRSGSPFEALFAVPEGSEESAAGEVCGFVTALLNERIVLAVDGRPFRGGNRWISPNDLGGIRNLAFSASWGGSFDSC